jgi:large subunit ribosomal protein L6
MSRIGNQSIPIPSDVSVNIEGLKVIVEGPKGSLQHSFVGDITIQEKGDTLIVTRNSDDSVDRAFHGLARSLLANMVQGVKHGFDKTLDLVGVGYRVQQTGKGITLDVMLSHSVVVEPQDGVKIEVEGNNKIKISGSDKQAVGQMAASIRKIRPPNVYTGKGIRYSDENVRLKPGKSARRA